MRPGLVRHLPGLLAAAFALSLGPALAQSVPVLRLPGAGPVAGVVETRLRDGFDQRIRYAGGDGRNHAEIALRTETGDLLLAFPPRLAKPSQFGIEGEIAVRFPGQLLRVAPGPRRNAYGPVGLAVGADCLYAWQWFERPGGPQLAAPRAGALGSASPGSLEGPLMQPTAGRRALSLRIRLCRTAQASLGDLIASVERMSISLPDEVARAVRASAPSPVRRPRTAAKARVERPVAANPPAPEAPARPEAAVKPGPSPVQPPSQPPVPPPAQVTAPPSSGSDTTGRRYLAPVTPEAVPQATEPGGQQRFIADVPRPGEAPGRDLMPSPAPGRTTGESLSRDMPAEAYRPAPDRGAR